MFRFLLSFFPSYALQAELKHRQEIAKAQLEEMLELHNPPKPMTTDEIMALRAQLREQRAARTDQPAYGFAPMKMTEGDKAFAEFKKQCAGGMVIPSAYIPPLEERTVVAPDASLDVLLRQQLEVEADLDSDLLPEFKDTPNEER